MAGVIARPLETVATAIAAAGGQVLPVLADVGDAAAVERLIAAAVERFGRLDVLINNAAVRPEQTLDHMILADWHAQLAVNLGGAFLTVRSALVHLRASGAIVTVGGLSGHPGAKQRVPVVTAKAGLVGFTRALAHELAGDGITGQLCRSRPDRDQARSKSARATAPPGQPHAAGSPRSRRGDCRRRLFSAALLPATSRDRRCTYGGVYLG
jgi:NAD(P)-dependent dehydrogenase (short-subunit alcohol dehydrogenase family)